MNDPELLPNGPYGPEFGSFGQVVRSVEVYLRLKSGQVVALGRSGRLHASP